MRHAKTAALLLLATSAVAQERPLYKDAKQPVDERVRDLLSRMTLEEKVAQTLAIWKGKDRITDEKGQFTPATAGAVLKLPISFPRDVGQLPVYYGRKPTSFRRYLDLPREPLFAFGHGKSYTTFKLEGLRVAPAQIGPAGRTTVSVEVANAGARKGDEVVQLYVRDKVASVTRPVKELRGFERVTLEPGQRRTVTFTLGPEALRLTDERMSRVVEPGFFDVLVGASSASLQSAPLEVVGK